MTHYLDVSSEKTQSRQTADELLLHTTLDKALDTLLSPGCTSIKDTNWTKQGGSRRLDLRYVCTTSGRPELTACANIYCADPHCARL